MSRTPEKRNCFIISPIGDENSEIRRRADLVFEYVIEPVANECGYKAVRADQISTPGMITSQIIRHLAEDPLVIADLAGHNPNVFYELAIRHVARKPVIQIIQVGESIPFDVAPTRAIQLDHKDLRSAALCRQNLAKQIRSVEKDTNDFDNPISTTIDLQLFRQGGGASTPEKGTAMVVSMLSDVRAMVSRLLTSTSRPGVSNSGMSYIDDEEEQAAAEAEAEADLRAEEAEAEGQRQAVDDAAGHTRRAHHDPD